jgi:nucleoside transporter
MAPLVRARLSAMMFLYFFAVGAWVVTLSAYLMSDPTRGGLNFTTSEVGWVYSTFAFGGVCAPLVTGLLADRLFRAERVLGVSALLCAVLMFAAARWCDASYPRMAEAYRQAAAEQLVGGVPALEQRARLEAASGVAAPAGVQQLRQEVRAALDRVDDDPAVRAVAAEAFWPLFGLMLAYCFFMQLGLTLTTVLALRNLPDTGAYSRVRLFGTVGWIVAGYAIGECLTAISAGPLYLAAAASLVLGVYSFTLPPTPPKGTGRTPAEALGLPALKLFRDPSFAVFIGVTFVATGMNQFYVLYALRYLLDLGVREPVEVMTLGQVCEVACMFAIPLLGPRRWMKPLMLLGLAGYMVRAAALLSGNAPAAVALGVTMHGWSYALYYVVAALYLDREAPPHLRASAQGIITFASSGLGVWAGNLFAGRVVEQHRAGTAIDWPAVWLVPLVGCTLAVLVFALFFRTPPEREKL